MDSYKNRAYLLVCDSFNVILKTMSADMHGTIDAKQLAEDHKAILQRVDDYLNKEHGTFSTVDGYTLSDNCHSMAMLLAEHNIRDLATKAFFLAFAILDANEPSEIKDSYVTEHYINMVRKCCDSPITGEDEVLIDVIFNMALHCTIANEPFVKDTIMNLHLAKRVEFQSPH